MVAEELRRVFDAKGHQMNVRHIDGARQNEMPSADLHIFGSPTRLGKPIGSMHRLIRRTALPPRMAAHVPTSALAAAIYAATAIRNTAHLTNADSETIKEHEWRYQH
jgi:multimeric flavodoxin WrbA